MHLSSLARVMESYRYRYSSEAQLHDRLADVLLEEQVEFERERRLDASNRLDFFVAGGIAIEVKVDGSLSQALRQIGRYAALDSVSAVLLATTQLWGAHADITPTLLQGKPCRIVRLRRQSV